MLLLAGLRLHTFLAIDEPVGARILVVEGWLTRSQLDQAIDLVRRDGHELVLTTGGPIEDDFDRPDAADTYADRARRYIVSRGVAAGSVVAVPAPASARDRSFLNALMVREWVTRSGVDVDSIDVFSSGVHGRRSRALHRLALGPEVRIGIFTARPTTYDLDAWWQTSAGAKDVLAETIAWLWTELFFHPGPQRRDELAVGDQGAKLDRALIPQWPFSHVTT